MESTRPKKRPRTDCQEPEEPSYVRGKVWFEDGNVVLVAEGTAFCVYKGVLIKDSEIFRDMFTMPQPGDAEKWEGCPVVQLSDTKQDLTRFLLALFDLGSTYVSLGSLASD